MLTKPSPLWHRINHSYAPCATAVSFFKVAVSLLLNEHFLSQILQYLTVKLK